MSYIIEFDRDFQNCDALRHESNRTNCCRFLQIGNEDGQFNG